MKHIMETQSTYGNALLSDSDLLALITGSGETAHRLVNEAGTLAELSRWSPAEIAAVPGIGETVAARVSGALELARRAVSQVKPSAPLFNSPELVFNHMRTVTAGLEVEKFWVLCLNRKNRLMKRCEITSGTASSSLVHPREVFREAIRCGALSIVAVHNHPSGDPSPSSADIQVTRQLREAGKTVSIELLDHIVVGDTTNDPNGRGFYSFKEAGLL